MKSTLNLAQTLVGPAKSRGTTVGVSWLVLVLLTDVAGWKTLVLERGWSWDEAAHGSYSMPAVFVDADSIAHLRGTMRWIGSNAAPSPGPISILPDGYRYVNYQRCTLAHSLCMLAHVLQAINGLESPSAVCGLGRARLRGPRPARRQV